MKLNIGDLSFSLLEKKNPTLYNLSLWIPTENKSQKLLVCKVFLDQKLVFREKSLN